MTAPTITRSGHVVSDTHLSRAAAGTTSPRAIVCTTPKGATSVGDQLPDQAKRDTTPSLATPGRDSTSRSGQWWDDTQPPDAAAGTYSDDGHNSDDTQGRDAVVGPTSGSSQRTDDTQSLSAAAGTNFPADQMSDDTQVQRVGGEHTEDGSAATTTTTTPTVRPSLADPFLALAADVVDDTERTKIANQNRLRQLLRGGHDDPRMKDKNKDGTPKYATPSDLPPDSDDQDRGFGLDESHPDVARLATLVDLLAQVEHNAVLNLQRLMRKHPLGAWCKAQTGIGEKQAARLLAVIGDPYWHDGEDRPRTVSELWSYCGHGDARRRIRKGMTQAELFACGSPVAKSRVWLVASKTIMFDGKPDKNGEARPRSIYRDVYDDRKNANEGRLHADVCKRCGPSGKPAQTGSPWSDGHRHADALRIVGKEILRDLWAESCRIHEEVARRSRMTP